MKKSIIIILSISLLAQFISSVFLFKLEKKYPDFDNNIFAVPVIGQDSPDFYRLSKNIREHHFFSIDGYTPESFRTPGYPVFLALTGGGYISILFSILITALSSVLIYLIGRNFLPEKYSLLAGLVYALSPSALFHGIVFLSDGLFTFFLILIIYSLSKKII